jgi:hypothetical protein
MMQLCDLGWQDLERTEETVRARSSAPEIELNVDPETQIAVYSRLSNGKIETREAGLLTPAEAWKLFEDENAYRAYRRTWSVGTD